MVNHRTYASVVPIRRRARTVLEKFLSLFVDIRAGEGALVLALALNLFVLLGAYYVLKTARESLILSVHGAAVKTYVAALQSVLLMIAIPVFGSIASRVNRLRLITFVLVFFIANLLMFFAGARIGMDTSIAFFVWVGIFSVMAVAQFWGFANDLFYEQDGKRLFPLVGVGGSLGAVAGAAAAKPLIKLWGPFPLFLLSAALLVVCIGLTAIAHRDAIARPRTAAATPDTGHAPLAASGSFRLVLSDRYLLLLALLMIILNVVNTSGEFLLSRLVTDAAHAAVGSGDAARAAQEKWIGAFYADFFSWVNVISLAMQAFLVYRIFRHIGVAKALLILPAIALGIFSLLAFFRVLPSGRV